MIENSTLEAREGHDGAAAPIGAKRVLLICPPFQHARLASIAVARLATYLRDSGVPCEEAYLHFELMRIVGVERYMASIDRRHGFTAELLFAEALHDRLGEEWQERLAQYFGSREERAAKLERFKERCLARIEAARPDIVGLTTSFNQLLPALWIARELKRGGSNAKVVLGGTSCSQPLGGRILEGYPWIDHVVAGYGEQPLLALARGGPGSDRLIVDRAPPPLEDLPLPDYRPFMCEAREFGPPKDLRLQFQSSRGCWWGERKHCAFCGLNGDEMIYSALPSERVVDDVRTLWERHGCNLNATDCIIARDHLENAMGQLARFSERPWLFYELKAGLTEEQVETLAAARVVGQVGIESLSTRLLGLMNKGGTQIRVLALLKWCREKGARIVWNLLYAIPGEKDEDHLEQAAVMDKIPHLQPPRNVNPIHVDRYSPYFERYREYGWTDIEPAPEYRQGHPHLDEAALRDIAYHFHGVGGVAPGPYLAPLKEAHERWKARHERGDGLFLDPDLGLFEVADNERRQVPLDAEERRIIASTHRVATAEEVVERAGCDRAALDGLIQRGIVHAEGKKVLNLAVRARLRTAR